MICANGGLLWTRKLTFWFHTRQRISWLLGLTSQVELYSRDFVKYYFGTKRVTFINLGRSAGNLYSVKKVSEITVYMNTKHDFIASEGNYVLAEYMAWGNWSVEYLPTARACRMSLGMYWSVTRPETCSCENRNGTCFLSCSETCVHEDWSEVECMIT
jgi:hypothetical protein